MEIIVFFLPLHQPLAAEAVVTQVLFTFPKQAAPAVAVNILQAQPVLLVPLIKVTQVVVAQPEALEILAEAEEVLTL
jgi:hypothetical protein